MTKQERAARLAEISKQIRDLREKIVSEKREMSEEERSTVSALTAESKELMNDATIEMVERMNAAAATAPKSVNMCDSITKQVRSGEQKIVFRSDPVPANSTNVEPFTPVTVGPVVDSLTDGTIYGMLGLKIQSGMKGAWKIPVRNRYTATVVGEGVTVVGTDYKLDKVTPTPKRLAIGFDETREAFIEAGDSVGMDILQGMKDAIAETINSFMFDTTGASSLKGFFVNAKTKKTATSYTYKTILGLKASVDKTKIRRDNSAAYVMNSATAAELEATPKGSGDKMILEEGKINGVPVFITNADTVADGVIHFGYFSYGLLGFFGNIDVSIDTQSKEVARAGIVAYTTNIDVDMLALRNEAFGTLTVTVA